jgi:AcrR family transcriptional regulator
MSPAHRVADPNDPNTTRDALMDAAIAQLSAKGVLAGLNLREVADVVGVTPANIYYYFGTRQGLLRAALAREIQRHLADPVAEADHTGFVERRLLMFDAIGATHELVLTALLALDGDPDYEPLPFIEHSRHRYAELVAAGELDPDLDIDAAHLLGIATAIGVSIYAAAAARQLGTTTDELRLRTRAVFERMLTAIATADTDPRRM